AAAALAADLRGAIVGEVRFDDGDRALYATDASNYRQVPIGVVVPRTIEDVIAAMRLCRAHGAPFLSRGGGTSLAGQCCNVAVIVDYSKYLNHVVALDPKERRAQVEPGTILDDLRTEAERHHLTFAPDPSTHDHNTLGGMLGNNSCGTHSVMGGRTADNVRALDVLTYDGLRLEVGPTRPEELAAIVAGGGRRGEIYRRLDELQRRYGELIRQRYPKIPRRVSGYNLDNLLPENGFHVARALVGSEGTCVAILGATLDLVPSPPHRALAVLGFPDIFAAGDAAGFVRAHGPIALEAIDDILIEYMKDKHRDMRQVAVLPEGRGWLIAEFGGDSAEEAAEKAEALRRDFARRRNPPHIKICRSPEEQQQIWKAREAGLGSTAFVPHHPDMWEGWEDSAVPPDQVGAYCRDLKKLFYKYGYDSTLYGHFGDGCIHCRINFGLRTREGARKWRRFMDEAADLVISYGGSLSGEHGDGQSRAELLPKMFGPELVEAFRAFKAIWDPEGRMNPGKIVDPYPITSNLRLGPDYHVPQVETHFRFPDDEGRFARAAIRCVGVGKCRSLEHKGAVMCPSFQATREEKHSTRGRARLLFEMLHGGAIGRGWRDDAVEDALSLCLACKGCKGDCPVNVDMATYKAEFRAHYYAGRLRPRAAYSMGLIYWWSRLAAAMPPLANLLTQTPGIADLVKRLGGIAPERRMPRYAEVSFVDWFHRHRPRHPHGRPVVLFPDTFTNFFRPQSAVAATLALEEAGFRVAIPRRSLCCGRPLYDWGMLDEAKHLLRQAMAALDADLRGGAPLVVLEPACAAAFRDELVNLFPEDDRARRLARQTTLFSELVDREGENFPLPHLQRRALVHFHCHHKAVLKTEAEERVLRQLGLELVTPPSGCCGMAGSFGFESDKYAVSMTAAEEVLLPAVRAAGPETLIVADGFSCREQIEQAVPRTTKHLAEVVAEGMGFDPEAVLRAGSGAGLRALAWAGGAAALGLALGTALARRRAAQAAQPDNAGLG
ncbi:MAG TPA: FAD-binding and (Fe-S)-binding domain-containing protein, partial [Stellaceae bacterium]|nr:FAD-binding and (Fe-S)-binding domain-containing protein [Stellaceae bacterium]